jgi:hypothetical protein
LSIIGEIIRDSLIVIGAITALAIALLVVIAKLPHGHPLKHVLAMATHRLGATAAAGIFAIPIEPIPGLDVAYDIGIPMLLIWYWYTFFRDAARAQTTLRPSVLDNSRWGMRS